MAIEHAILGLLSWRSLTGYDLKKMFEDSVALYWSGNNNEIYRTLVRLHQDGLVTREIQPQESLPARKIYTITERGRAELKSWVLSPPELPLLKHSLLIQLAWADSLTNEELDALLGNYEEAVFVQYVLCREQQQPEKDPTLPRSTRVDFLDVSQARSKREAFLWGMILENWAGFYENELNWVRKLRRKLERA
jgi:DNA-binding PadR family transcriptional regulator